MGEQRNLTEENVKVLKAELEEMKKGNSDLEYRFWEQEAKEHIKQEEQPPNSLLLEKLEALDRKLDLIFDGHVLINGQWTKITPTDI